MLCLQSILDDVNRAWLLMLHQLLNQLKQDLGLPRCLQIVGHLRRMEVFTELELKLKFLQARGHWLEHCLKYIPKDDGKFCSRWQFFYFTVEPFQWTII